MVLVSSFRLDVQVHLSRVAQTLEEMQEHLRRHFAHFFPVELCIPYQPGSSSEVERHLAQTVVHRQTVTVSFYTALVAQCLQYTVAQGDGCVFYRMVLVHLQVALRVYGQVHHPVFAYLFEHVVEKSQSGCDVTLSGTVQIDFHIDGRQHNIDFILAVGGGSAIDSAKAIAAGVPYDGDFWDFFQGKMIEKALRVATVLTISAAGSEGSPNTVITHEK